MLSCFFSSKLIRLKQPDNLLKFERATRKITIPYWERKSQIGNQF